MITFPKLILALVLAPALFAQPRNCQAAVDHIIKQEMDGSHAPGFMVVVIEAGKAIVSQGYGTVRLGARQTPTAQSVFPLGSVSKALTGIGVLTAPRKINVDDPLGKYLRDIPEEWKSISLDRFLSHSSGIGHAPAADTFVAAVAATKPPMAFKPGMRTRYNNFNYAIMGQVIEQATDKKYARFHGCQRVQTRGHALDFEHDGQPGRGHRL